MATEKALEAILQAESDFQDLVIWGQIPMPTSDNPALASNVVRQIKMWMIDTGAGQHFIGRKYLTAEQLANLVDAEPITFTTANGQVPADKAVILHIDALDLDLPVYVLPDSLPALSAGMLCRDNGCHLILPSGSSEMQLIAPNGRSVVLTMKGACPWLPQGENSTAAPFTQGGGEGSGEAELDSTSTLRLAPDAPPPAAAEPPPVVPDDVPPPPEPVETKEQRLRREAKSLSHMLSPTQKPILRHMQ